MRRSRWTIALLLALTAALPSASRAADEKREKKPKPEIHLSVSAHHGKSPLNVTLTGSISGIDPKTVESCSISEEWVGWEVSEMPLNSKRTFSCVSSTKEGDIPQAFTREVTLKQPGTYIYRILIKPRDGRAVASASREVKVVRSPVELGIAGEKTEPHR